MSERPNEENLLEQLGDLKERGSDFVENGIRASKSAADGAVKAGKATAAKATKTGKAAAKTLSWIIRCVVCGILGVVIGVLIMRFGFLNMNSSSGNEVVTTRTHVSAATVRETLQTAGDLSTLRMKYSDFEEYTKDIKVELPFLDPLSLPGSEDRSLWVYSGTIDFRYNLKNMDVQVDESAKKITVTMPPLEAASIDTGENSFKEYIISNSMLVETDLTEFEDVRAALAESKRTEALADADIVEQSQANAQVILKGLLQASDLTKDYMVEFIFQ